MRREKKKKKDKRDSKQKQKEVTKQAIQRTVSPIAVVFF